MNTNKKEKGFDKVMNPIEKVMDVVNLQQEELADVLGVTRQTLSSYGKNPESIPNKVVKSLMLYSGLSYDELFSDQELLGVLKFPYEIQERSFVESTGEAIEYILNNKEKFIVDFLNVSEVLKKKALDEIALQRSVMDQTKEKLQVVIIGPSAVGKSTLANYMLGQKLSPISAQSDFVACPIIYKSKSDRVKGNDAEVEVIMNDGVCAYRGNWQSLEVILSEYCNRTETGPREVTVFTEADLLKDVVLIDFPAIGHLDKPWGEGVDYILDSDIIILLSSAYTGITMDEILALKLLVERGVDINRLLIVKNKACLLSEKMKEEKKLDKSSEAQLIAKELFPTDDISKELQTKEELEKRICYMDCLDPNSEELRSGFAKLFGSTVQQLMAEREQSFIQQECRWCDDRIKYYGEQVVLAGKKKNDSDARKVDEAQTKIRTTKEKLREVISERKNEAVKMLEEHYEVLFNEQNLEEELKKRGERPKDDYVKAVIYRLTSRLRENLNKQYDKDLVELHELFDEMVKGVDEVRPGLKSNMEYDALGTKYMLKLNEKRSKSELLYGKSVRDISMMALTTAGTAATLAGAVAGPVAPVAGLMPLVLGMAIATMATVGRSGVWEKRTALNIANSFKKSDYLNGVVGDVKSTYERLYDLVADYCDAVTVLIQKENGSEIQDTDQSAATAKVMLCQSMVEMYYSIKTVVGVK